MKSNKIFEIGDRVYDIRYGWGEVTRYQDHYKYDMVFPVVVKFDSNSDMEIVYTLDGKSGIGKVLPTLSFREYSIIGFTQTK